MADVLERRRRRRRSIASAVRLGVAWAFCVAVLLVLQRVAAPGVVIVGAPVVLALGSVGALRVLARRGSSR